MAKIKIEKYEVDTSLFYEPEEHFWLRVEGSTARLGMSPLIQESKGAFVAIKLDPVGKELKRGEAFGTVEAEKHVGPLKAPLSGKIIRVNEAVEENPRLINTDPFGEGWILEMELTQAETEVLDLVIGADQVTAWFKKELEKFEDKGWIAH